MRRIPPPTPITHPITPHRQNTPEIIHRHPLPDATLRTGLLADQVCLLVDAPHRRWRGCGDRFSHHHLQPQPRQPHHRLKQGQVRKPPPRLPMRHRRRTHPQHPSQIPLAQIRHPPRPPDQPRHIKPTPSQAANVALRFVQTACLAALATTGHHHSRHSHKLHAAHVHHPAHPLRQFPHRQRVGAAQEHRPRSAPPPPGATPHQNHGPLLTLRKQRPTVRASRPPVSHRTRNQRGNQPGNEDVVDTATLRACTRGMV